MIGKLKNLGVALAATMALGMTSAAGAQAFEIHATTPNAASIFATQTTQHALTFDAGTLKCSQVLFEGLMLNTGESKTQSTVKNLSLTATYTTCNLSGFAAVVDMNGCKYTITGVSEIASQLDITGCTPGKLIEITTASCTVTVPEQHGRNQVTFVNTPEAAPHDLDASIAISALTYQTHGTCSNTASDHTSQTSTGEYAGAMTIQAREPKGTEQKSHNGHTYEKLKQTGGLVGLIATAPPLVPTELHAATPNAAAINAVQTTQHQFTVDAGIVKCGQMLFEGLAQNAGESQTQTTTQDLQLTATATQCNISGINAVVDMNGCKYTITGVGLSEKAAHVDITGCTPGKVLTVTTATCTVTVPEQSDLGKITFANTASDVNATISITGITYQTHGTCPNTASDHTSQTSNGTYTGAATIQAAEPKGTSQSTHNGHTYEKLKSGGSIGLQVT